MLNTDTPTSEQIERPLFDARSEYVPESNGQHRAPEDWLWSAAGTLLLWRRFIAVTMAAIAIVTVVLLLLMPNWYAASSRVLAPAPTGSASLTAALTRGLPSAAVQMLGGQSGDYARYLTILSSRRMLESVVDSFDLATVYDIPKSEEHRREEAIRFLAEKVSFPVDEEFEYLSVVVLDTDPQRAADMANFFVRRLNAINAELSSQNAGNYRRFIETRYLEAERATSSVLDRLQAFQQKHGLFDVSAQAEQFFSQVGELRANAIEAEIRHEVLRAQLGPQHSEVQALGNAARIANQKVQQALAGQERLLPVPQSQMSAVMREFLDLKREGEIQARILEIVRPMLEQARFDEQREVVALQVVDAAVPPTKKAKPRRSILAITITLSGFLLTVAFILVYEWWRKRHAYVAYRLQRAMRDSERMHAHAVRPQ